jgi:tripartite-type tricarboxylate transporter receptor subunit TctC
MRKRYFVIIPGLVIVAVMVAACTSRSATPAEEPYPTKPITYMIPFDAGGQSDREARREQPFLEKSLGQSIIIENKPGGGGAVGWAALAIAKPDGYYIAGISLPHIILQPLQQDIGYKTEQIQPVCLVQRNFIGLAVPGDSPYTTVQEFIDASKANPGGITIGGSGTFTGHHLATLHLQQLTGIQLNYVPFTGSAPQMTAVLGNQVNAVMANSDDLVKYKDKLRLLAIASAERFPPLPDVPTFSEAGIKMVETIDRGIGVPAGTSSSIVKKLEAACLDYARNPDIKAAMEKEGFIPLAMGAEESQEYINQLLVTAQELVKGLK